MSGPAETLRAAAAKLRTTGAAATPGPWEEFSTDDDGAWPRLVTGQGDGADVIKVHEEIADYDVVTREDTAWIALANPALAEPLAAWLEDEAETYDFLVSPVRPELRQEAEIRGAELVAHALAVAHQILGTAP